VYRHRQHHHIQFQESRLFLAVAYADAARISLSRRAAGLALGGEAADAILNRNDVTARLLIKPALM